MNSRRSKLKCLSLIAVAMGVAACVEAQTDASQEQPLFFSSPDYDGVVSNVPSLAAKPPALSDLAGMAQTSSGNLNAQSQAAPLPPPMRILSPAEAAEMQHELDVKKNWALMTPEEILGIPTPEKIAGVSDLDKNGLPNNETTTERFLDRKEQQRENSTTTGLVGYDPSRWDSPDGQSNLDAGGLMNNGPANPAANSLFNVVPGGNGAANAATIGGWSKLFSFGSPPPPTSALTTEQIASDEAFQKLIESHPQPAKTFSSGDFFNSQPAPDPFLTKPQANPIGVSFAPLGGGAVAPTAVKSLPGLFSKPDDTLPAKPEWTPQLPPWMASGPQPGVMPQRKF